MRAAQINDYGDKNVLAYTEDATKPTLAAGQVLVEAYAAGVNPFDYKVRSGQARMMAELHFPATLGGDVAGVVTEVGEGVTGFEVGQEVYGQANALSGQGSFAEFVPVKSDSIAPKPANIDFVTAAALPLVSVSAYQALVDTLHLLAGQRILIHGGAGGIGASAIQIAKHLGAYVITTAGPDDLDYVRSLGADEAIDYTSQKFEEVAHDMDAVYDTVGGETYQRSFVTLKVGGQIVSMVEQPNEELATKYNVKASLQFSKPTPERLAAITHLVEAGDLNVTIDKTFPLEQASEAVEYLHSSHHRGKVVIKIK
jgi:NADPH:quinone reductase-like Zn-dependent oxidoreductase